MSRDWLQRPVCWYNQPVVPKDGFGSGCAVTAAVTPILQDAGGALGHDGAALTCGHSGTSSTRWLLEGFSLSDAWAQTPVRGPFCSVAGSLWCCSFSFFSIWKSKDFMLYLQPREETIMLFVGVPSL